MMPNFDLCVYVWGLNDEKDFLNPQTDAHG